MPSVADALRQHALAFLAKFGKAVPSGHRKVLGAITRCRTGELGGVLYKCKRCGRKHWVGRACGNRHCPACGKDKTHAWLDKQTARLADSVDAIASASLSVSAEAGTQSGRVVSTGSV